MNDVKSNIEQLFRQHYRRMFLTACALLGDDEEARDAVSEVFAYLLSAQWSPEEQRAEAWLLVAVRNHCLNVLKHRKVAAEYSRIPDRWSLSPFSSFPSPLSPLYAEIERYIAEEMTEPLATVVSMRYLEDRRAEDIAKQLGIKRATVYQRLQRGVEQIRNHFKTR